VMKKAISCGRKQLISLGTCFGKFTKTGKFKLHVTAIDYLAQYAKVRVLCTNGTSSEKQSSLPCCVDSTKCGSNPMVKCHFSMVIMSSRRTLAGSQKIHPCIKESWFYPCRTSPW